MKKKIAVLHAQVPFVQGGAETMVASLVRELKQRGYDADLVSVPFRAYPYNALEESYFLWRMLDLTESNGEKIDLVIPLKVPTFMVRHPNKVLWLMHQNRTAYDLQDYVEAGGMNLTAEGRKMMRKLRCMDNIGIQDTKARYAISKTVARRLKEYNGIDAEPLYHPPGMVGRYYTGEYGSYILSVGRLNLLKRVDLLIRALPHCDTHIHAVIAGKGPDLEHLQKLADSLGVSNRVHFLGFVSEEDLLRLYADALAVCFPPVDEDYGYITLEAFLSRKPVITCQDSGGVLEFVKNGQNGMIVEPNPEQMGGCFDRLFHNRKMARDFGNAGYDGVKDISWDHITDVLTQTIR